MTGRELQSWLLAEIALRAGCHPDEIDVRAPLTTFGLDSAAAVQLSGALEAKLGRRVSPTVLYDCPTVASLVQQLTGDASLPLRPKLERSAEPLAIVGIGCRFPGAAGPRAFHQLLCAGRCAIGEVPRDRWEPDVFDPRPGAPGKSRTRWGGFLEDVRSFDAAFFGVAPKEAARMDPQQRLLLEVTWEALEDAAIVPSALSGSTTGVFVGISHNEYRDRQTGDLAAIDAYVGTGNALSIAANRISYVLDLHGPSMAVDSACSSSLMALHLACSSMQAGECEIALVAGVNLILSPELYVGFSQAGVVSPTGRCRVFDAAADGYTRSEGVGSVVLKRLSAARRDGDRIYAVVRGSATFQDGRSNGLMAPNGRAQEQMLLDAYQVAGVDPRTVQYVEAHGTGTVLGDPIEARALGSVLGRGRSPEQRCRIGSVKSNIGHLEAAAGIAGLIKTALSLYHRSFYPSLHFETCNPHIDLAACGLQVQTALEAWSEPQPLVAGVSSFGFGGTNVHVVLEGVEQVAPDSLPVAQSELVTLSARSSAALRALAAAYARELRTNPAPLRDIAYSALTTREQHPYRLATVAADPRQLAERLESFAEAGEHVAIAHGEVAPTLRTVFFFPGHGWQWPGMGRALMEERSFRESIEEIDDALARCSDIQLVALLADKSAQAALLRRVEIAQPVMFALQVALARQWQAWGVSPTALIGLSFGEIAAAAVGGALSLSDAARVVCRRAEALRDGPPGTLASLQLAPSALLARLPAEAAAQVSVAVDYGADGCVLAGPRDALRQVERALAPSGEFFRWVDIEASSHHAGLRTQARWLVSELSEIEPRAGSLPILSTVTAGWLSGAELGAEYWGKNLEQKVRVAEALELLFETTGAACVEISGHPLLTPILRAQCARRALPSVVVGSLRREEDDRAQLLYGLASLYVAGASPDARAMFQSARRCQLPTYPFERKTHWFEAGDSRARARRVVSARGESFQAHPLLERRFVSAAEPDTIYWEAELNLEAERGAMAYLRDHRVGSVPVAPAALFVETVRAAASEWQLGTPREQRETLSIEALQLSAPLRLTAPVVIQVALVARDPNRAHVSVHSRSAAGENRAAHGRTAWTLHANADVALSAAVGARSAAPELPDADVPELSVARLYRAFSAAEIDYGPSFCGLKRLWGTAQQALAELVVPPELAWTTDRYALHPALFDSALQSAGALLSARDEQRTFVPSSMERLRVHGALGAGGWVRAQPRQDQHQDDALMVDLSVWNSNRELVVEAFGVRLVALERTSAPALGHAVEYARLEIESVRQPAAAFVVLGRPAGLAARLAAELGATAVLFELSPDDDLGAARAAAFAAGAGERPLEVVCTWPHDLRHDERVVHEASSQLLPLVNALAAEVRTRRCWFVTGGAQALRAGDRVRPAQAAVWGLCRTVQTEHPGLGCTLVDLGPTAADPAHELVTVLSRVSPSETELVLREGAVFGCRIARARPSACSGATEVAPGRPFVARQDVAGELASISLHEVERRAPAAGELEVLVDAAGLNFRDVMLGLGLIQARADAGLGSEFVGRVARVGDGVHEFAPGDRVLGFGASCFASHVLTDARRVARCPEALASVDAVTLPSAASTAAVALRELARVRPGDRVLIHSAAGGVGLCALRLARSMGAELFVTAGSEAKRAYLRDLGIEHVFDSRSLAFAAQIRAATRGEGVDVVLNSLAGEAFDASLALLRAHGRFVEIGKREIFEGRRLPLQALRNNITFSVLDLESILADSPSEARVQLESILDEVARGQLAPLPAEVFPVERVADALRRMSVGQHIGKLVLQVAGEQPQVKRAGAARFAEDGSYVITGGLGGIGLELARWLVERGVTELLLLSRRAPHAHALRVLKELRRQGAHVQTRAVDVSDRQALQQALNATTRPLRGVMHLAADFDDGVLREQTEARFARVFAAKARAAQHLHELTCGQQLTHFVLFSSAASLLGSPGQANYAAANAYLEGLALERAALGLPVTCLSWGPWATTGYAAQARNRSERLARQGVRGLQTAEALSQLDAWMAEETSLVGVFALAGEALDSLRSLRPAVFSQLGTDSAQAPSAALHQQLSALEAGARQRELTNFVRSEVSRVLGADKGALDEAKPFSELGLDSLMAVELKNRMERQLGLRLSASVVFNHPDIEALARYLSAELSPSSATESRANSSATAERPAAHTPLVDALAALTEEQAEEQLLRRLAQLEGSAA